MASGPAGGSRHDADPLAPLLRWVADDRVRRVRAERVRQGSLLRQAGEATRWRALLVDLAERGQPVALAARCGLLRGTLAAVGQDFCAVGTEHHMALVAFAAVGQVWADDELPWGFRGVALAWSLPEALTELALDRPVVRVQSAIGPPRTGRLERVGGDVMTIRADHPGGSIAFNLAGIDAVTLSR